MKDPISVIEKKTTRGEAAARDEGSPTPGLKERHG